MEDKLFISMGSIKRAKGWRTIRLNSDLIALMRNISDSSMKEIYIKGVITEIGNKGVKELLAEALRILHVGGVLSIAIDDVSYIACTLDTKYYAKHSVALNRLIGKKSLYTYPSLAKILLKSGYVFVRKDVCPFRLLSKMRGKRGNARQHIDEIWSFPIPTMVISAKRPERDTDSAFGSMIGESSELDPTVFEVALSGKGKRHKLAESKIQKTRMRHGQKKKETEKVDNGSERVCKKID